MAPVLRPAQKKDYSSLHEFTSSSVYSHSHLDWRNSLEWLGRSPFWIFEEDGEIQATLACPPEPAWAAWVRLFAVSMHTSPDRAWKMLFERCLSDLKSRLPIPTITSLAFHDWYEDLLRRNGFEHYQDVVVFIFDSEPPGLVKLAPRFRMRKMEWKDLPGIVTIDHLAFEPIWRLSPEDLQFAARKSSYCTVIEQEGEIIAYQMSSSGGIYGHLARLAVHPALQRQQIGSAMLQDLLDHFINQSNTWGVTLNTQDDNTASIALYRKIGFRETGECFPVFLFKEASS